MKARYRLIRRGTRGGAYYCVDTKTGKRTSLGEMVVLEAETASFPTWFPFITSPLALQ
jgi:hypothetical protein